MDATLKNAVITGSNRGLGLELCKQLAEGDEFGAIYALCRKTSEELTTLAKGTDKIKVMENVQVTDDNVTEIVQNMFATSETSPTKIHLLVHNAGAWGLPQNFSNAEDLFVSQNLQNITAENMRFAFELNTVAPLRITQALLPNLVAASETEVGKVIIVSSAMGSIGGNTSGGSYAYRSAKAAANMVGKSLSVDLKDKNVAVGMIHPGYIHTGFIGQGSSRQPGQREVGESARGVVEAIGKTTLNTTGSFWHGNYGEGVKDWPW